MFHVFILVMYLNEPDYIWMSTKHWDTKEQCEPFIRDGMKLLQRTLADDRYPLVGICDTKENQEIKENRHDRPS